MSQSKPMEATDEGPSARRKMDTQKTREIYRVVMEDNWDHVQLFCKSKSNDRGLIFESITVAGDTVLHFAASDKHALEVMLQCLENDEDTKRALSKKNYYGNTALHMAAASGNLETTKMLLDKCPDLLHMKNTGGETPLYRAATFGRKKVLSHLFYYLIDPKFPEEMENRLLEDLLELIEAKWSGEKAKNLEEQCTRNDGLSILHVAVRGRHIGTALWIARNIGECTELMNPLDQRKDNRDMTCLQLLADMPSIFESGFLKNMNILKRLIYHCVPVEDVEVDHDNTLQENSKIFSVFQKIRLNFDKIRLNISNFLAKGWPVIDEIRKKKKKHRSAVALTKSLAQKDISWEESHVTGSENVGDERKKGQKSKATNEKPMSEIRQASQQSEIVNKTYETKIDILEPPLTPLLLAASNGIIEVVNIILEEYPQAIDHISAGEQNILHIAIKHRQKGIYQMVKRKKRPLERLVRKEDKDGNNILHQVGVIDYFHHEGIYNPALALQGELRWFERVKRLVPDHYKTLRNEERKTPAQRFEDSHREQLKEAHEWSKDTSQSCSTVAALIATIVFAAAYTVPAGSENGVPIFLGSTLFKIFTVMDILSLGSSLTSLVLFLSILTSPFKFEDFYVSIPGRMMFGFTFLLISVATSMIAFTVTILLTVRLRNEGTRSLIYVVGFLPVSIFALLHFPLIAGFKFTWRETHQRIRHFLPRFTACSPCFLSAYKKVKANCKSQ